MQIKIVTTFIDRTAEDPEKAEIKAGTKITVSTERGTELVALGLAEPANKAAEAALAKQQ